MKKIIAFVFLGLTLVLLIGCKEAEKEMPPTQKEGSPDNLGGLEEGLVVEDISGELDTSDLDNLDEELNFDWLE